MRKTFVLIAAALMAFGAVSCKKEIENNDLSNRPVRFSATMENSGDSKTTLNGYALLWADGDQVKVMCDEFTSAGVYQVVSGGKRHADFVFAGEESSEETLVAPFKAGYPADYWNDNVTSITLPATQNYVANGMEQFPMYGEVEEGFGVDFKNVCGVIRLRLTKPGESVTKIVFSTTKYMNGEFGVSFAEGVPAIEHLNGGDNFITLNCAEPVSINSATDFYIYLPAGTYNPMRIEVYNNRGLLCEMNSTATITIERNKITTIAPSADKLKFTLVSGLISVSVDAAGNPHYVRFANGNLQYVNNEWKLADNQWEIHNSTRTTRDKFGYSTPNTNYGLNATASNCTGDFVDWGDLIPGNWRTLSKYEYNFAAKGSSTGTGLYTNIYRGCKTGTATISMDGNGDDVTGLVMMPDEFEESDLPSGINFYFMNYGGTRPAGTQYQNNVYTKAQWDILAKQYGAVFLPIITGTPKSYWTSTALSTSGDPTKADVFNISINRNAASIVENATRTMNYFVRLVQDYEPLVIEVNE